MDVSHEKTKAKTYKGKFEEKRKQSEDSKSLAIVGCSDEWSFDSCKSKMTFLINDS